MIDAGDGCEATMVLVHARVPGDILVEGTSISLLLLPDQRHGDPLQVPARSKTLLGRAKSIAGLGSVSWDDRSRGLVEAHELAQRARERVRAAADDKHVDVVIYSTCSPLWVQRQAFEEALYELLDNAVRATRRRHPVLVDVRNSSDGDVLWQIQDTGEGMSEDALARLGRPPRSVAESGVDRAWAVIEKHGGMLRFESALGVGTTASIWLPATP
jgi:signal transduction histidine kinase